LQPQPLPPLLLHATQPQTATKKVYFIGHSLGGAMASIAAVRFQHLVRKSVAAEVGGVWLFGCPRVGNAVSSVMWASPVMHTWRAPTRR
jgi:pimeloyl-ACP methyl ester carboxylesterase